jgi:Holliday junction resolvase RusA-like endonuclease
LEVDGSAAHLSGRLGEDAVTLTVDWNGWAVGENRRNGYSRRTGRAFPNPKYQAFLKDLAWTIKLAAPGVELSQPRVSFLLDAPRLDVDALVKPVLDAVEASGVIVNDREIRKQGSERAALRLFGDWRGGRRGPHFIRLTIEGNALQSGDKIFTKRVTNYSRSRNSRRLQTGGGHGETRIRIGPAEQRYSAPRDPRLAAPTPPGSRRRLQAARHERRDRHLQRGVPDCEARRTERSVTTERCLELFGDQDLQRFIRSRSRRRAHDEQLQADCFAAAWTWISEHAPDDLDLDALKRFAEYAIDHEYRQELRHRRLVGKLLDICIQEDGEVLDFEPYGHRWDAGMVLETRRNVR